MSLAMSFYLTIRNRHFYYRQWIPSDCQQFFPYPEIKFSLRTTSRSVAKKDFSVFTLDNSDWISSANINWNASYDIDGIYYSYPSLWFGYNPSISVDSKEAYYLNVESVNGDTNLIGKKSVLMNVLQ